MGLALAIIFIALLCVICYRFWRPLEFMRMINKLQGPRYYPVIGSGLQFKPAPEDFWEQVIGFCAIFHTPPKILRLWLAWYPYVLVYGAHEAEAILANTKHLEKSDIYDYLHPWLGLGLLTSYPDKWKSRRKQLTPTFHYDILRDFMHVFNEQACILVQILTQEIADGRATLDVYPYVTLCALDIITQTAMGRNVGAQRDRNSEYVRAVYKLNDIIHERHRKPWMGDFLFYKFGRGEEHDRCVEILQKFTRKVIEERSTEIEQMGGFKGLLASTDADGSKKRLAFLDLLLDMAGKGDLTLADVQEETDTFMFEGHDTTSAGMNWALQLIGLHPDVQEKLHRELDDVFGPENRDGDVTFDDLKRLHYLEMCVKEALRLYPSVPIFGRRLTEDCKIGEKIVPKNSTAMIIPYVVHRDPDYWTDPEIFNPERFSPENSAGRHPFAYLPFSAGSRNCIGQRFALMEEKVVLAWILRRFNVRSVRRLDQIRPKAELILRPSEGILLQLSLRRPVIESL